MGLRPARERAYTGQGLLQSPDSAAVGWGQFSAYEPLARGGRKRKLCVLGEFGEGRLIDFSSPSYRAWKGSRCFSMKENCG